MALDERDYMRKQVIYNPRDFRATRGPEGSSLPPVMGWPASRRYQAAVGLAVFGLLAATAYFAKSRHVLAQEQPFPSSGVHVTSEVDSARYSAAPLLIGAPASPASIAYCVELSWWMPEGSPILARVFIRPGEEVHAKLRLGTYRVRVYEGASWYGSEKKFGPTGQATEVVEPIALRGHADRVLGMRIDLARTPHGNLQTIPLRN